MSRSTLHLHFAPLRDESLQFQKQLRLHAARQRMLTVDWSGKCGVRVGYESPSQFNREYRRFLASPNSHIKALQDGKSGVKN